jgi:hypothetical protein
MRLKVGYPTALAGNFLLRKMNQKLPLKFQKWRGNNQKFGNQKQLKLGPAKD